MGSTKGQKLLKVCGILFIISGIIGIIVYGLLTLLLGYATFAENSTEGGYVTAISALYVVIGIIALIAGILGVKYAKKPEGAGKCLVWGCIYLVLCFAIGIWSMYSGGVSVAHIIYTCASLIFPSLYVAGAYLNE